MRTGAVTRRCQSLTHGHHCYSRFTSYLSGSQVKLPHAQASQRWWVRLDIAIFAVATHHRPLLDFAQAGEVITGMCLGPQLADIVPYASAVSLLGQLGLYLLVIEAGFEIKLPSLREVGSRAIGASFTGISCCCGLAFGISQALGLSTRESLAVAASLTAGSTGIALRQLKYHEATNTPVGQLIIATTIFEDLLALTLLSELKVVARQHEDGAQYLVPVAISIGAVAVIGPFAVWILPHVLSRWVLPRVPLAIVEPILLLLLFALAAGLVAACQAGGASPLLGAFLAGVSFCQITSLQEVWRSQVKRMQAWLIRLFYAGNVAFNTPVQLFAKGTVWARAACLYCATLGKLSAGLWATPRSLPSTAILGTAMAALGEFSFIGGTIARNLGLMAAETYASVTLAVLFTIVVHPVAMSAALAWAERRARAAVEDGPDRNRFVYYKLAIKCSVRWGLVGDVLRVLNGKGVEVVDCRLEEIGQFAIYEAYLKDLRIQAPPVETDAVQQTPAESPEVKCRIGELRVALLEVITHDAAAATGASEGPASSEDDASVQHTVDFSALRGVSIHRWFPKDMDAAPDDWDAAHAECTAGHLMQEEAQQTTTYTGPSSASALQTPSPVFQGTPTPTSFRAVRSFTSEASPLVPSRTSLDSAMAAMASAQRGASTLPGEGQPLHRTSADDRRLIVDYDPDDVHRANRLVAQAHAQAERHHAAQAARSHGLLGIMRHHVPRGLGPPVER